MRVRLTVRDGDGPDAHRDVCVDAAPGTTLGELGCALPGPRPLFHGSRQLPETAVLGAGDLVDGAVLTAVATPGARGAGLRLDVVGGPAAGAGLPLPLGTVTIGRSATCDLVLPDPDVSRVHATVSVTRAGVHVTDHGSTNGSSVDGLSVPIEGCTVATGARIRVGDSTLQIRVAADPIASVRRGIDGRIRVHRPPREPDASTGPPIELPSPPTTTAASGIPWLMALLPALAGVGLAVFLHSPQFLAFALLSPVMVLGSSLSDRWRRRRGRRRDDADHRASLARAEQDVAAAVRREIEQRHARHPDPCTGRRMAAGPTRRLWERRPQDSDALSVRVGLADQPSGVLVSEAGRRRPAAILSMVPVTVDLRLGALGLCGPDEVRRAMSRWIAVQLCLTHPPADVQLALILDPASAGAWQWARWLPHLGGRIADTPPARAALLADLGVRLGARREASSGAWQGPWTVVIVESTGALADQAGLAGLIADGPALGITALCLDAQERRLPAGCSALASVRGETGTRSSVRGADRVRIDDVVIDQVSAQWADGVARALAPLDAMDAEQGRVLPTAVRLLDRLDLEDPHPDELRRRWALADPASLAAVVGVGADGPVEFDLVRDGPHALIAGTTGSGKSEFLQTLVAGLAARYPPEDVNFVLIDYKGGAAFADCADLPHCVGMVSDLDAHLTRRALTSLAAELRRREALFARAAVADLAGYRTCTPPEPLGRLLLVVDEFATLAEELPDFVRGLVSIAQRGRSLGVHLVLATQRPSGVISPEIRANTTLRMALRVTDAGDSSDVIGGPQAAGIEKGVPGRAYLRAGASLQYLQTARIGAPTRALSGRVQVLAMDRWARVVAQDVDEHDKTDLGLLVAAAREAAAGRAQPAPRRPWLPPLPAVVRGTELSGGSRSVVPLGLADDLHGQRQEPIGVDLDAGGCLLVAGAARSGRSTVLLTAVLAAAARLSPDELHVYALDFGGGALGGLLDLPHCGAVITRDAAVAAIRLLERLTAECARRAALLSSVGAGSVADVAGEHLPRLLLVLDGWEGFAAACDEVDGGRGVDLFLALLRDAGPIGLTVLFTGGRGVLASRVCSPVSRRFVLRMADAADYALAGLAVRTVPDRMPPGRAVAVQDGRELQFAQIAADPASVRTVIAELAARCAPAGPGPIRVRALPLRVRLRDLPPAPGRLLLGLGGDAAEPVSIDPDAVRLLVAGPARSGRSSALALLLAQCGARHCLVAASARSPLRQAAQALGVAVIGPAETAMAPDGIHTVFVDDCDAFLDTPAGDAITDLLRHRPGLGAVVSGRSDELALTFRGVVAEIRRNRTGVLLQPGVGDGDLLGVRLPRSRPAGIPGRGVLVLHQPHLAGLADGTGSIALQVAAP